MRKCQFQSQTPEVPLGDPKMFPNSLIVKPQDLTLAVPAKIYSYSIWVILLTTFSAINSLTALT
jgi:hypothetical protein